MEKRNKVTQRDLLITESLIARSYERFEQSLRQIPSHTISTIDDTISTHPFLTTTAAVGFGITLQELSTRICDQGEYGNNIRDTKEKPDLADSTVQILSFIIPLVTPFLIGYLEKLIHSSD